MARTLAQILQEREGRAAPELVKSLGDGKLQCFACGHACKIPPGRDGICRVRRNVGGELRVPRGYVAGLQVDPIEKKPFFHVLPGNDALSFGMLGCDLHCAYCFPADTRVATSRGPRRIGDLFDAAPSSGGADEERRPDDDLRAIADDGTERAVRKIFRHRFEGELVELETRFLPGLEATPDHPILVTSRPGEEEPRFVPAGEVGVGSFLAIPRSRQGSKSITFGARELLSRHLGTIRHKRRLPEEVFEKIAVLTAAGATSREIGLEVGLRPDSIRHMRRRIVPPEDRAETLIEEDGRLRFRHERQPGIAAEIALGPELAELLGLYCAEGCLLRPADRPRSASVVFSFGHSEGALVERTRHLIRQVFGVEASESVRDTTRCVVVGKTSVALLIAELGGIGAAGKRVPEALHGAAPALLEAFLRGLVAGDGHRYADGKVNVTTVSEDLAWGVASLLVRLDRLPSLYVAARAPEGTILGRTVRQQPKQFSIVWREKPTRRRLWRDDERFFYVPVRATRRRPFAGWVYNLEVEGRHTYVANGFAVHNCQNWVTSQALRDTTAGVAPQDITPGAIVELALRENAPALVSTYNEPLITAEWAVEVFREGAKHGLMGAFVSNGNATPEVLDFIRPYVQAYKIDLKSFDDKRYRSLGAPLEHILEGARLVHGKGFHLEVVSLLIPGFNDSDDEVRGMARFLASLSPDIPWHITGFHTDYKMDASGDTPAHTLVRACELGVAEGLRYVYAGNRPGQVGEWENTRCHGCRATLVRRRSFRVLECRIGPDGLCPDCKTKIPGVWDHVRRHERPASAPAVPRRVI